MAVNTQDATVAVRGLLKEDVAESCGVVDYSTPRSRTVGRTPIEENFGSMEATARPVKNTKAA